MFVINRKMGRRIHIADGIDIRVLAVRGRKVRLGIEVPEPELTWENNRYRASTDGSDVHQPGIEANPQFRTLQA